ncbi:MAG: DUF5103 domain-containing protein [Bacteroidales bacterium]|nr:DUF5103 domain-containing protein [Bacteroidales bacterium]
MRITYCASCLILFLLTSVPELKAQPDFGDIQYFDEKVFDDRIKTVLLHKEGWNLSYPVIKLKSSDRLILKFDLLGNNAETYYYTFVHCDKDWKKSGIFPNTYLNGYAENPIEAYRRSFNTTVSYFNYSLSFPNDRVEFVISGNYALVVYDAQNPSVPVITKRFVVTEDAVSISMNVGRPLMTKNNDTHQQVTFTVSHPGLTFNDPVRTVFASILQNGRWNSARTNLKPDFFGTSELKFNSLSDKNIFSAGNEFRYFDIKSIRYQSEFVMRIDYVAPWYNVKLFPSENREFKSYFYWQDFNGKYYIAFQEGRDSDTEADYVNVFFTLPSRQPVQGGRMYVSGALNNWNYDNSNEMTYNQAAGQYECTMLLKQGWYNYEYFFRRDNDISGVASAFEGSHWETENDYSVIVYFRNPRDRYDRVVGYGILNSSGKTGK